MININKITNLKSSKKSQLGALFFFTLYAFFCTSSISAEVFFSQDCKKNIIELINNSEKEIQIAVYSIDDPDITQALFSFIEKGGKLQVITDRVQAAGRQSRSPDIYNKINPNFKINSKRFRIMHDKFAIFDLKKTVNGSFNWTYSAANKNAEDCKISNEEQDVARFYEKFKDMWDSFSNEETDLFFKKLALKKEIKLKLEQKEKEGKLYSDFSAANMTRFDSNKFKFCIKLCRNKCTKQEIIRREVASFEKNYQNNKHKQNVSQVINTEDDFNGKQKNSLFGCKKKCHNKCIKKILIQKELLKSMTKDDLALDSGGKEQVGASYQSEKEAVDSKEKISPNLSSVKQQYAKINYKKNRHLKKYLKHNNVQKTESTESEDDAEMLSRSAVEVARNRNRNKKLNNSGMYKNKKFKKWKPKKRISKNIKQNESNNLQNQ